MKQKASAILAIALAGLLQGIAPVQATTNPTFAALAAGDLFTCGVSAGAVKCWGDNLFGELGNGAKTGSLAPVGARNTDGSALTGISKISAAGLLPVLPVGPHGCAVSTAGGLKCWGSNYHGQVGDGTTAPRTRPVAVQGLAGPVRALSVGGLHPCALMQGGTVMCWGANGAGQLGDSSTIERHMPVQVAGLTGITAIAAGADHTCALAAAGGVKCWGDNGAGELGNGSKTSSSSPVDVTGVTSGVVAITAGLGHTCALTNAGALKCWGYNASGQLGNGIANSSSPVDVTGLDQDVTAVAAGGFHTCALTTVGGVKCWGENGTGQVGDGSTTDRFAPVDVLAENRTRLTGIVSLAAGNQHTCALTSTGRAKCWGFNHYGQLGDGTTTNRTRAIDVVAAAPQTIALTASGLGTIKRATSVAFTAVVRPAGLTLSRSTVRFVVYHQVSGAWRLVATRDVLADAKGKALLRWPFAAGQWYVRAKALGREGFAISRWSSTLRYAVK